MTLVGCEQSKSDSSAKNAAPTEVIEKSVDKGPVKLSVRVSPKEPRLSDQIDLELTVRSPLDVDITPPPFGKSVGEFLITDYHDRPVQVENETRIRKFEYKLEPVRSGTHMIRSMGVSFVDRRKNSEAKAEPIFIETEPFEVRVTSELGDAAPSLTNLAPMASPVALPAARLSAWVIAACVAVLGLAIGGAVIWQNRTGARQATVIQKSPEQIASEELAALLAEDLPGKGLFKEFYVRITGIVRRYIERTTGINAPEQTTEEFLRAMHTKKVFAADRADRLAQFLEAADMVKYAAVEPSQRQIEETTARAREFVGLPSAFAPMPVKS
jgi:hypothetical protein